MDNGFIVLSRDFFIGKGINMAVYINPILVYVKSDVFGFASSIRLQPYNIRDSFRKKKLRV